MKGCVADENQSVEIGSDYRESLAAAVMSWRVARKRNTDRRFFRRLNKRRLIILTNRGDVTTPRSWRCAASIVRRPTKTFDPKYYATLTVRTRKREGREGHESRKRKLWEKIDRGNVVTYDVPRFPT